MTKKNTIKRIADLNVYVVFHLQNNDTFNSDLVRLESTISEIFSDGQQLVYQSKEEMEAIFRIPKPITDDKEELKSFFLDLQEMFNITFTLSPHFTQHIEGESS